MIRDYFQTEGQYLKAHFKEMMMMRLSLVLLILHSLCAVAQGEPILVKPNCKEKCGNISVPYPFGIDSKCSAGSNYTVVCNGSAGHEKLFLPVLNLQVDLILLQPRTVRVLHAISPLSCSKDQRTDPLIRLPGTHPYNLSSTFSRFVVVGCDNVVSMIPSYGACNPICRDDARGCNGINCCEAKIPRGVKELDVTYQTVKRDCGTETKTFKKGDVCGYAFLTDDRWVKAQATRNFSDLSNPFKEEVNLVLHWGFDSSEVRNYPHVTCNDTTTENSTITVCFCDKGFDGNPYLPDGKGCQDIDECKNSNACVNGSRCVNKEGSYTCEEPIGKKLAIYAAGSGVGALLLLVGGWTSTKAVMKKRDDNLKSRLYDRNGGPSLEEELRRNGDGEFRIFRADDLARATGHYKNLELGRGRQGVVHQGLLTDGTIVAVKTTFHEKGKDKEVNVKAFVTEVSTLSRINHKNIVKLIGCCLETEVPILVYEYVRNGTLYQYIHDSEHEFPWEGRLKMATEIAEALSELHNAKPPFLHKDVKSMNILLDKEYQAKVSDFGMPWSVSIDKDKVGTRIILTDGYVDMQYLLSKKYTDKNDVYSFGVVMVELLTRKKAVSDEGKEYLANRFLDSMKENKLFDMVDEEIKHGPEKEILAFAELAKKCLNSNTEARPTMKEATEALVGIKNPKERSKSQSTEIEALEASEVSDYPSSSTTPNLNVFTGEP